MVYYFYTDIMIISITNDLFKVIMHTNIRSPPRRFSKVLRTCQLNRKAEQQRTHGMVVRANCFPMLFKKLVFEIMNKLFRNGPSAVGSDGNVSRTTNLYTYVHSRVVVLLWLNVVLQLKLFLYTVITLHSYSSTQSCLYTVLTLHSSYSTQLCLYTVLTLHSYSSTQLCLFTVLTLHSYSSTQLCLYTVLTLHSSYSTQFLLYTVIPLHSLSLHSSYSTQFLLYTVIPLHSYSSTQLCLYTVITLHNYIMAIAWRYPFPRREYRYWWGAQNVSRDEFIFSTSVLVFSRNTCKVLNVPYQTHVTLS